MSGECDRCGEHCLDCKCGKQTVPEKQCQISGCRQLQTICLTCGRVVCTKILPNPSEWISVKNRLPETDQNVLFFYDDKIHIGVFYGKSEKHNGILWQSYIDGYNCIQDSEFWIPLPEIPK